MCSRGDGVWHVGLLMVRGYAKETQVQASRNALAAIMFTPHHITRLQYHE